MKKYIKRFEPIDFISWESYSFNVTLWDAALYGTQGCGPNVLAMCLGKSPLHYKRKYLKSGLFHSNPAHMNEEWLVSQLESKYNTIEIAESDLLPSEANQVKNSITRYHLLLSVSRFNQKECSYSLIHNNLIFHNSQITPLDRFEFLHRPVESLHILKKK